MACDDGAVHARRPGVCSKRAPQPVRAQIGTDSEQQSHWYLRAAGTGLPYWQGPGTHWQGLPVDHLEMMVHMFHRPRCFSLSWSCHRLRMALPDLTRQAQCLQLLSSCESRHHK